MKRALVFGGSGQIGTAVSETLLDAGWQVVAAARSGRPIPPELTGRGLSAVDAREKPVAAVLDEIGTPVDALVHPMIFDAKGAHDVLACSHRFGALVAISTASVYADGQGRSLESAGTIGFPDFGRPVAEGQATVDPAAGGYSSDKVAMELALAEARVPVGILRPGAVHGPHGRHPREWWFIKRGMDGRKAIPVAYGGESRFHTTSTAAVARLVELCLREPCTVTLNVADVPAPSVAEIAAAISEATGLALPLIPFDGPPAEDGRVGGTPWSVPLPFVLDCSKAQALGWQPSDYARDIARACRWIVETARQGDWREAFPVFTGYGYNPFDYAAEDAFLARR